MAKVFESLEVYENLMLAIMAIGTILLLCKAFGINVGLSGSGSNSTSNSSSGSGNLVVLSSNTSQGQGQMPMVQPPMNLPTDIQANPSVCMRGGGLAVPEGLNNPYNRLKSGFVKNKTHVARNRWNGAV